MKMSILRLEIAERADVSTECVYRVLQALGEIFLEWIQNRQDEVFKLGAIGVIRKVKQEGQLRLFYSPSPDAKKKTGGIK